MLLQMAGFLSLSSFQIYDTVLLTTVMVLYITSPGLTYLMTGSLYLLTTFTHFGPTSTPCLRQPPIRSLYPWVFCYCFLRFHIYEIIQYLSLSVWLISLSIMPSRSIHVVSNGKIAICDNTDGPWGHYAKWNRQRKINTVWSFLHTESNLKNTK